MKKTLFFIFLTVLTQSCCNQNNKKEITPVSDSKSVSKNFDWLLGNWERQNEKEGRTTYERWIKTGEAAYAGTGFTLQNRDTVSREKIRLVKNGQKWTMEVTGKEDTTPTVFKVIKIGDQSFTCENKEIEFPNHIRYWKEAGKLKAKVSGGDMVIDFEFRKN